jgi:glutathione S-transferase
MPITMYDLAGADPERRFSPFCWRTKLALAHKSLEFETIPWRYHEKSKIAFANWDRVPVIVDSAKPVVDSWNIAVYLEEKYRTAPLFGGSPEASRFFNVWTDAVINPIIARIVVLDILQHLVPGDRDYFRRTREERLGAKLEDVVRDRESRVPTLKQALEPLRQTLAMQPYLGGESPLYSDYIVFSSLMWARAISPLRLLESDDPVNAWSERLLDCCGGLARRAPRYW